MKPAQLVRVCLLATGLFAASSSLTARPADACGGCLVPQGERTLVSAHRMAMSISPVETTLWDQIEYDGDPSEFAWVLPIQSQVEVGLSSDLLFAQLGSMTAVTVYPSWPGCEIPWCYQQTM